MELDIKRLLLEICDDPRVEEPGINLVETGIMDSYAMIELFAFLEEEGIQLQPTRIDRTKLQTVEGIEELIKEAKKQ